MEPKPIARGQTQATMDSTFNAAIPSMGTYETTPWVSIWLLAAWDSEPQPRVHTSLAMSSSRVEVTSEAAPLEKVVASPEKNVLPQSLIVESVGQKQQQ